MHRLVRPLILPALLLLGFAYLVQIPTPLRMNTDAITYLSLAASFNDHHTLLWHGHHSHFPAGYPLIVAALERAGVANAHGLLLWNYLMLAVVVIAGSWLLRHWLELTRDFTLASVVIFLLSYGTIRYAPIPGSEMTYTALSFVCLICLLIAETKQQWIFWILAVVLTIAVSVRLIGVTLFPAVLWTLIVLLRRRRIDWNDLQTWIRNSRGTATILIASAIVLASLGFWLISRTAYFHEAASTENQVGIFHTITFALQQRCIEASSLLSNIPTAMRSWLLVPQLLIGIVALVVLVAIVLFNLRQPSCVEIYLLGYLAVLLIWPYRYDVRFWLPVQLLLFGLLVKGLQRPLIRPMAGPLFATWGAIYVSMGILTLAHSTRLTYSGPQFSERYDLTLFRDTYRRASHNGLPVDPEKINPDLLPMLYRYGHPDFHD